MVELREPDDSGPPKLPALQTTPRQLRWAPVVFDDIHFERRPYDKWLAYGQAKTANVLFAVELERRLELARGALRVSDRHEMDRVRIERSRP